MEIITKTLSDKIKQVAKEKNKLECPQCKQSNFKLYYINENSLHFKGYDVMATCPCGYFSFVFKQEFAHNVKKVTRKQVREEEEKEKHSEESMHKFLRGMDKVISEWKEYTNNKNKIQK
jgi:hypothetical protein